MILLDLFVETLKDMIPGLLLLISFIISPLRLLILPKIYNELI